MALFKCGFVRCPNCDREASVGIAKEGEGRALYVTCRRCKIHIQTSRWEALGERVLGTMVTDPERISACRPIFGS